MKHRILPLRSHHSLSDQVLASAVKELYAGVSKKTIDAPELTEVQKFMMERLEY